MSYLFRGQRADQLGSTLIKSSVDGDVALTLREGDDGQTANLFEIQKHDGTVKFSVVGSSGNTSVAGTLAVTGATTLTGAMTAASGQHLALNTTSDDKNVRINSRSYTTSGNNIAFQSKPAQAANGADITGGEISPRVNDTFTLSGSIKGLHVDAFLKGTSAGTITGDVRALNLELVTDDAGTRTISGNVNAIRIRSAFSATTISGKFVPIRIEKAEAQTNSKQYDAVLELPSTNAGIWHDDPNTEPSTAAGYIKVLVNGNARYIQLYSTGPTD